MFASPLGHTDPTAVVAGTDDPAFGTDERGRIVVWNSAAERLLGHRADEVVGRRCAGVIGGRDVFGNLYCTAHCIPRQMARGGIGIRYFSMDVRRARGDYLRTGVSNICIAGPKPPRFVLVHVLHPGEEFSAHGRSWPGAALDTNLTRRELEVLHMLGQGVGTRRIADHLCISVSTVRKHIQNVLSKLGVHSRLEAICLSLRERPGSPSE